MNLNELHKKYPWKTMSKFLPIAQKHGFTKDQVKTFLNKSINHDKKFTEQRQYYLPIFGRFPGVYQFDTLVQSKHSGVPAFLIIININSRKAYAYPMANKGTNQVLTALNKFMKQVNIKPVQMTSDQDSAYLSTAVVNFFIENGIDFRTTEDRNHNILGVINRFIRTLRDINESERDFTEHSMKECIDVYNSTTHSSTGKAPDDFTQHDFDKYISKMEKLTAEKKHANDFTLKPGDKVRIVQDSKAFSKKRTNLSKDYYVVDSQDGNSFIVKARDDSIAYCPRHKLVKSDTGNFAETLDDGKRGIVEKITSYDSKNDTYSVVYSEGTEDVIKAKNLRETRPTRLGPLEVSYWNGHKDVPKAIEKFRRQ